jgi:hypothetical protein
MTIHSAHAGLSTGQECANTFTANPVTRWVDFFEWCVDVDWKPVPSSSHDRLLLLCTQTLFSAITDGREVSESRYIQQTSKWKYQQLKYQYGGSTLCVVLDQARHTVFYIPKGSLQEPDTGRSLPQIISFQEASSEDTGAIMSRTLLLGSW